eukprot:1188414-Prorocentrum_minimum.AAC.1
MPGGPDRFEYVLHTKAIPPHLFIVCKQQRLSPDVTKLLAIYYVLDGTIYPGPSLHSVLSSRTVRPFIPPVLDPTCSPLATRPRRPPTQLLTPYRPPTDTLLTPY